MRSRLVYVLLGVAVGVLATGAYVAVAQPQDDEEALKESVRQAMDETNRLLFADDEDAWAAGFIVPLTAIFSDPMTGQGIVLQFEDKALRRFVLAQMRAQVPERFGTGDFTGLTVDIEMLSPSVAIAKVIFEPQSPEEENSPPLGYTIMVRQGVDWRVAVIIGGDAPGL